MLQTLKFKGDEESYWFSSDLHMNQSCSSWEKPLWRTRGFDSAAEHFQGVIKVWNETVKNSDIVFHIGDITFQDPKGEKFNELVGRLNYSKLYLFLGNHNSGQSNIYNRELNNQFPQIQSAGLEVYPLSYNPTVEKTVVFLPHYANVKINSSLLSCCHFPIISHQDMGKGSYMISGHSHNNCPVTSREKGQGRRIDVGWDAWGKPISLKYIKDFLKNRDIDAPDHH